MHQTRPPRAVNRNLRKVAFYRLTAQLDAIVRENTPPPKGSEVSSYANTATNDSAERRGAAAISRDGAQFVAVP